MCCSSCSLKLISIDSSLNLQIQVCGKIAYVSQNAWIQTGTVQDNILFGSSMDKERYQETLLICSLVKDLELLPYGDHTQIGERGVNLSGGQKQRVQLARALYQNADIYLLDDPFSSVDAYTATSLFTVRTPHSTELQCYLIINSFRNLIFLQEYVMGALSDKTVLLVTHQVDFLPVFDCILVSFLLMKKEGWADWVCPPPILLCAVAPYLICFFFFKKKPC
jgi:ABC-type transport system involved in cytochrome bd biosynthesis fused ATPase/permease subunit